MIEVRKSFGFDNHTHIRHTAPGWPTDWMVIPDSQVSELIAALKERLAEIDAPSPKE